MVRKISHIHNVAVHKQKPALKALVLDQLLQSIRDVETPLLVEVADVACFGKAKDVERERVKL